MRGRMITEKKLIFQSHALMPFSRGPYSPVSLSSSISVINLTSARTESCPHSVMGKSETTWQHVYIQATVPGLRKQPGEQSSHYEELVKQSHQASSPYHFKTNPGSGRMRLPGPQCREVISLFTLHSVFMQSKQQPNHWLDPLPRKLIEEDGHFQGWQQSLKASHRAGDYCSQDSSKEHSTRPVFQHSVNQAWKPSGHSLFRNGKRHELY